MIRFALPGTHVELHYREETRPAAPHLARGVIAIFAHGRGPHNALIALDDGRRVVVPSGHLMEMKA